MELTIVEIEAVSRLLEKLKEKRAEKVKPGAYDGKVNLEIEYSLVKDNDGKTAPQFKKDEYVLPAILLYAASLDSNKKKPKESIDWLYQVFSDDGVMGKVIRQVVGAKKDLPIPSELQKELTGHLDKCKITFKSLSKESPKQGNTTVSGTVLKVEDFKPHAVKPAKN